MKGTYLIMLSLFAMVVPSTVNAGRKCHKAFVVTKCSKSKGSCRKVKVCVIQAPQAQKSAVAVRAHAGRGMCRAKFLKDKSGKVIRVVREGCEVQKPVAKPGMMAPAPAAKSSKSYSTAGTLSRTGTMSASASTLSSEEEDESITDSEELDESSDEGEYDEVYDEEE